MELIKEKKKAMCPYIINKEHKSILKITVEKNRNGEGMRLCHFLSSFLGKKSMQVLIQKLEIIC